MVERSRAGRRNFRIAHRGSRRIWSVVGTLSARCPRQTVRLENGPRLFPDHVRDDGAFRCLRRLFRGADHERTAAAASSHF